MRRSGEGVYSIRKHTTLRGHRLRLRIRVCRCRSHFEDEQRLLVLRSSELRLGIPFGSACVAEFVQDNGPNTMPHLASTANRLARITRWRARLP